MKKTLISLSSIAAAASAHAHVSGVAHTHNDSSLSWANILTIAAALIVSVVAFRNFRKTSGR